MRLKTYALLGVITLVGLALRLYHNLDISLWHDEAFSALLIKYPWNEMIYRIGLDVHPPLYYFALRLWHYLFGDALASLRGFSVFFGVATIPASFFLVRNILRKITTENSTRNYPQVAGIIAAILVALNPFQIQYATEARMYTFGAFIAIVSAIVLIRALEAENTKSKAILWSLFAILTAAQTLTHYYLIFTAAAMFGYALVFHAYFYRFQFKKYTWLFFSAILSGLLFLPWMNWFLYQYRQVGSGYWIPPMDIWSIPTTLYHLVIGTGLDINKSSSKLTAVLVTVIILGCTAIYLKQTKTIHKWLVVFVAASPFAGSILFLILAAIKGSDSSVYLIRYFSFVSPFFAVFFGMILGKALSNSDKSSITKISSAVFLLGLGVVNIGVFHKYWSDIKIADKGGMREASKLIVSEAEDTDVIVVGSSFQFFNLKYYLNQARSAEVFIPTPLLFSGGQETIDNMPHFAGTAILTNADLLPSMEIVPSGKTAWLLWTNGFGGTKPQVPDNWVQVSENGFAEVRPYVGTWIVVNKYSIQ